MKQNKRKVFLILVLFLCYESRLILAKEPQVVETGFEPHLLNSKPFTPDSADYKQIQQLVTNKIQTDTSSWKEITGGEDFIEEQEKKKKDKTFIYEPKDFSFPSFNLGLMQYAQIIFFVVIVVALVFIVFRIIKISGNQNRKLTDDDTFWHINLNESDSAELEIQDKLSNAILEGNYTFAIRLYYLKCLNELNRKSIIVWKKDKTNAEYIREIKSLKIKNSLKKLTYWFELFWFGDRKADEPDFRKIETSFLQFLKAIET